MIVHGFNANGTIDATIEDIRMTIPDDIANRHRQMVAEWESGGNVIPPYVPPAAPDPLAVPLDRLDFWLAAASAGVSKWSVRDRISAMPHATPAESYAKAEAIAWFEEASHYRRDDPLLIRFAAEEGIPGPQLDALWTWTVQSAAPVPYQPG
jgi:hypothetical protein